MSWTSILPDSLVFIETWAARLFLLLAALTIGPWLLLIVYDLVLYVFRAATYEVPYVGGRARNRPRPRAPSLSERPSGEARKFNLGVVPAVETAEEISEGLKRRVDKSGGDEHTSDR